MLQIIHAGTKTHVKHDDPALPAAVSVPSRREAIESLGYVEHMVKSGTNKMLVDGETITVDQTFDVLRRFILTR